jgi:hypothetical protein
MHSPAQLLCAPARPAAPAPAAPAGPPGAPLLQEMHRGCALLVRLPRRSASPSPRGATAAPAAAICLPLRAPPPPRQPHPRCHQPHPRPVHRPLAAACACGTRRGRRRPRQRPASPGSAGTPARARRTEQEAEQGSLVSGSALRSLPVCGCAGRGSTRAPRGRPPARPRTPTAARRASWRRVAAPAAAAAWRQARLRQAPRWRRCGPSRASSAAPRRPRVRLRALAELGPTARRSLQLPLRLQHRHPSRHEGAVRGAAAASAAACERASATRASHAARAAQRGRCVRAAAAEARARVVEARLEHEQLDARAQREGGGRDLDVERRPKHVQWRLGSPLHGGRERRRDSGVQA